MNFKVIKDFKTPPFSVPGEIVDSHLKLAGALQLRVILYCLRHAYDEEINPALMAELFSVSEEDINDALMFWVELGFVECEGPVFKAQPTAASLPKVAPPKAIKPNRKEVARRGLESPEIAFLLNEAQQKFGRMLKQSESSVLVWIYDDLGMDASLILMVLEYAVKAGKVNISYIEKIAKDWVESGVDSIVAAEKRIVELTNARSAWNKMRRAFGLDSRSPSETESKLAVSSIIDWKMSDELLKKAYDICVDSCGKYNIKYIKKVLTDWHKQGISTVKEWENLNAAMAEQSAEKTNQKSKSKAKSTTSGSIDWSLMDEIINGD
ncbi:MAG: DnaD domain protein [Clostridia bacterium]|nr:DnaD domain protein [Clostridia bacterium]